MRNRSGGANAAQLRTISAPLSILTGPYERSSRYWAGCGNRKRDESEELPSQLGEECKASIATTTT